MLCCLELELILFLLELGGDSDLIQELFPSSSAFTYTDTESEMSTGL